MKFYNFVNKQVLFKIFIYVILFAAVILLFLDNSQRLIWMKMYEHNVSFEQTANLNLHNEETSYYCRTEGDQRLKNLSDDNCIMKYPNVHMLKPDLTGSFLERIKQYNKYISEYRKNNLSHKYSEPWKDVDPLNNLTEVWGKDDNFVNKLPLVPNVNVIVLPWIKHKFELEMVNVLYPHYYKWTASDPFCQWIETEVDKLSYWPNNGRSYPSYFHSHPPAYVLYLTILQDAVITPVGDVITGSHMIIPFTCSHITNPSIPQKSAIFKEVFIITQFWGTSYFHKMFEDMSRLAPYKQFLQENNQIMIHAPEQKGQVSEMLASFGINSERIITGDVRAKIVYLPQATPCGFPQVQGFQLLSHYLKLSLNKKNNNITVGSDYVNKTFIGSNRKNAELRKILVLIKRSGLRHFRQQNEIENAVKTFCNQNNLTFVLFDDNPVPSLPETMSIFHSSSFVVAPHGAGLANVMFCKQGSIIIEGVCNPPHVNMCYQFVSHVLGMRYHAIPSKSGCEGFIDIDPGSIIRVLEVIISSNVSSWYQWQ
ncbi:hypothetical protein HELRODRAFT_177859 [Helobdella robusta]|uniref:Glycosyltransferase 61 catalytic domain-containing protein n=1 Tax=Helobdella robusta TaxID=6412 RepID=T1FCD6_HELRO|nr:hypothetical protein HELRODRAFT_177859 [Helobdella robusta]ESN97795.1 hypothetical protein HELRODRAFT_177859 [Helobdella robusta]